MADVAALTVRLTFTPRASALLRDLIAAIRDGDHWRYERLLDRLERLEPLLKVSD